MPLLWTLRGGFAIHGSVVATSAGAVLFIGRSGAGKSTLAAAFESIGGCRVLDDDAALMEKRGARIVVHQTPRGLGLWKDSAEAMGDAFPAQRAMIAYGDKYRVQRSYSAEDDWPRIGDDPVYPLVAAFHIPPATSDEPDDPVFEPMAPGDRHMRLARSASRIDMTDTKVLRDHFEFLAHLVSTVPFQRLHFRREYALLPQVCHAILREVNAMVRT